MGADREAATRSKSYDLVSFPSTPLGKRQTLNGSGGGGGGGRSDWVGVSTRVVWKSNRRVFGTGW